MANVLDVLDREQWRGQAALAAVALTTSGPPAPAALVPRPPSSAQLSKAAPSAPDGNRDARTDADRIELPKKTQMPAAEGAGIGTTSWEASP